MVDKGNRRPVDKDHGFLNKQPPPVALVNTGKEETSLEHNEEAVKSPHQMSTGRLHRMVPKCVGNGPGEDVAVVMLDNVGGSMKHGDGLAKEQAATFLFHQEDQNQQQDD